MRILCCDDEEEYLRIYEKGFALHNEGFTRPKIVSTSDSEECLKIFEDEYKDINGKSKTKNARPPFDVVILDYKMPKKNGLELAKIMFKKCKNLRIIFASGNIKEAEEKSFQELKETVEVIRKPFVVKDLVRMVVETEDYYGFDNLIKSIRKYHDSDEYSDDQVIERVREAHRQHRTKKKND